MFNKTSLISCYQLCGKGLFCCWCSKKNSDIPSSYSGQPLPYPPTHPPISINPLTYNSKAPWGYHLTLGKTKNGTIDLWICSPTVLHLHLTTQAIIASKSIFLGITSYWSETGMRKINMIWKKQTGLKKIK